MLMHKSGSTRLATYRLDWAAGDKGNTVRNEPMLTYRTEVQKVR
ncbi:hypothetical protein [Oceanobacillus luteolus]|uniref:Uncharacterized protein n=1 Tax=Oceanobacillus luteolus TaxID=1274358 RepID=A0ABW4HLZ5_9BACI